ncbi:DUF4127 family protein [Paenibacillus vini]|uniref:DUF4127 family protein n=1 Tax=Paenibacillus vini TaxID=1476024 RepID=UPI0025B6CF0F|nr:DUF4127 family protein [Paenibacillus vini]MDN4067066.1 DUF4127 family protein [Paenibacillus vini]
MPKVVYLPLDERPCNYLFPRRLAEMTDLELAVPDIHLLGSKKQPADTAAVREWLLHEAEGADYLLVSIDLLIYGGIVPSRLHHLTFEECLERLSVLAEIKERHPGIRIHAFNLIMRVPNNNKDEEEPDYYKYHGGQIFKYSYLTDKAERDQLNDNERMEIEQLKTLIPEAYLNDFVERRGVNQQVNHYTLKLAEEGIIDHLIIPLDDNSEYGFSPKEQQLMICRVEELSIMDRVMIYPGADEIGCTMFAHIFCELKQYKPEIFVRYSSTKGPFIKPKYEDRSLNESVKSHLTASGAVLADHSGDTPFVLIVHSPAVDQAGMAEQIPFKERHRSYFSEIHYREIVERLDAYLQKGKHVALGDVATCNGGDPVLINLLKKKGLLDQLTAYAGWNTSGNTLGTVIAHFVIISYYLERPESAAYPEIVRESRKFYYERLVEDFIYQSLVRQDMLEHDLPRLDASYYVIGHCLDEVQGILAEKMNRAAEQYFGDIPEGRIRLQRLHFPWKRMFEIGFELNIETESTTIAAE